MSANAIVLTILGLFLGSLMWSYWLGKLFLKRDIRALGDGNPGAFNLLKTGNIPVAGLGIFLDIGKGVIPAGLAMTFLPVSGWEIVPVAVAPVIAHAFSPWMRFKGGKAVAVTGGVHIGLQPLFTLVVGIPLFVLPSLIVNRSGWAIAITLVLMFIAQAVVSPSAPMAVIWAIHTVILLYKYRADLAQRPGLRARTPTSE